MVPVDVDGKLVDSVAKAGVSIVLAVGMMFILWQVVRDNGETRRMFIEHNERQTEAFERAAEDNPRQTLAFERAAQAAEDQANAAEEQARAVDILMRIYSGQLSAGPPKP